MNYEEKYKEILEWVRKLYNDAKANEYKSDMEDYESIFPQLAESEDERIRRWLCDYFSSIDGAWIHKDITCIDILRWLEKQKEQKQEWSESDKQNINLIISYLDSYIEEHNDTFGADECKSLKYWLKSLHERFNLEPKPEWSEEDERMIGRIRSVVNECASYNDALDVNGDYCEGDYAKLDAWLKSLPLNLKKKNEDVAKLCSNEWSIEDEDRIRQIERIAQQAGCTQKLQEEIHNWLKSLRNRLVN